MSNISIISTCNNQCKYCFQQDSYHKKNLMLTYDEILDIYDWKQDRAHVGLLGGEPTMHPDIVKLLVEAGKMFERTLLMTNLTCDTALLKDIVKYAPHTRMLINTTTNEKYIDVFERNVEYLFNHANNNISMGLTFINDEEYDTKNINKLIRLGKQYPGLFNYYRLSVATPYHRSKVTLDSFEKPILEFVTKAKEQTPDIIPSFDCSINNCQVPAKLMGILIDDYKADHIRISSQCHFAMDVMADKSVKACSSLPDGVLEARHYRDFPSDIALNRYFHERMVQYLFNENFKICKNFKECNNDICTGPCMALTEHLKRSMANDKN